MEYLLVIGFSLLILIPITAFLFDSYQSQKEDIHVDHLSSLAQELAYQAEKIYYQGAPATTTVVATLPPNVERAVVQGMVIEFFLEGAGQSIYADASVPLEGEIGTFQGKHTITLQVDDNGTTDPDDDVVRISDR